MFRRLFLMSLLAAGIVLGMTDSVSASFLSSILGDGPNTFDDQNREAYVDVTGDDRFSVGDVLLGFVRLDNHSPIVNGVGAIDNRIYTIFTQQVTSITPNGTNFDITFAPTSAITAPGLSLAEITGNDPRIAANALTAVYSGSTAILDLIDNSPGNLTGSSTVNLFDYFAAITGGLDLTLTAGFGTGITEADDYFTATTISPAGAQLITTSVSSLATLPSSVGLASFSAGLSILFNADSNVTYNESVISGNGTAHQLVISNGAVRGGSDETNFSEWSNINPDLSYNNPGGLSTDADFFVNVTITVIPEPSSIALLALGIGCCGAFAWRRRMTQV